MRTSIILKDEILQKAMRETGIREKTAVIHLGLQELINKSARKRLIQLGGTLKSARAPRRKRSFLRSR